MIFTILVHIMSEVTLCGKILRVQKIAIFLDNLSRVAEVNREIFFNKNATKHIKLLNDISKFQKQVNFR